MSSVACRWFSAVLLVSMAALAGAADVAIENPRLRLLPGDLPCAGYFRLQNVGRTTIVLVGAESPLFRRVMMHASYSKDGMAGMQSVPQVVVGPGASIEFAPGGRHLMFMQREQSIRAGDKVPVTLIFEGGRRLRVMFLAAPPGRAIR